MPVLGITGGIATGKSTFVRALARYFPAEYFDADAFSRELLISDPDVRTEVAHAFGEEVYPSGGEPDRQLLREVIFADPEKRRALEAILHPRIRERWTSRAALHAGTDSWFCADIPLLFETNAEPWFSRVAVVACSPPTQRRRLEFSRGISAGMSDKIITAQLDLAVKVRQAHHLIWNDSTPLCLDRQAVLLAELLRDSFGADPAFNSSSS